MKRKSKFILVVLIGFPMLCFLFGGPLKSCWRLRSQVFKALDHASAVTVIEHSDPNDFEARKIGKGEYKEIVFSSLVLTKDQIAQFRAALPLRLDYGETVHLKCMFVPHHRVEIHQSDGSVYTLEICFTCGELMLGNGEVRMFPIGWGRSLRGFLSSIGMHPDGPWDSEKSNVFGK